MITKTKMQRWLPSLITAAALAGSAGLCQAQSPINISFDTGAPASFYDASPNNAGGSITNYWQATGGPDGSGCEVYTIDGAIDQEIDPAFSVTFNGNEYATITFQVYVASGSGTVGTAGSGGYGHLQFACLDASYDWNSCYYGTIYPPAANGWVTYVATVPAISVAHLQIQLQGGSAYSGPVTVYIGNVSVLPVPNPDVIDAFTNSASVNWQNYGLTATWDSTQDAPYYNPVNNAGPTSFTPAGSVEFNASTPSGYSGGQLDVPFGPQHYEWLAMDVYYDGPTPSTSTDYAGFQVLIANSASPYNWAYVGHVNFTAAMIGTWTHVTFPCASSGIDTAAGLAIQSTPGNTSGSTPITWHVDNVTAWNPVTHPTLTLSKNTAPGGVQISVDSDGTSNPDDQEGFTSPSADNNETNFFWIGQTPATYSFTLTNFPSPASAPGFDAHIYLVNGDSLTLNQNDFGYNQTYSGVPYNAVDYAGLRVQNSTNSMGVNVDFEWKTNMPYANATNLYLTALTNLASANGTWTLSFSSATAGTITTPGGSNITFTLPNFQADPNYNNNFGPTMGTSMVQFGLFKNDVFLTGVNDGQSATITHVTVATSLGTNYNDSFGGPGLTANYAWQIAEYYEDGYDREVWIPAGTAYWLKWNTTVAGYTVLSTNSLAGGYAGWPSAGVTYTYTDATGTNTLGAIPASAVTNKTSFFEIVK